MEKKNELLQHTYSNIYDKVVNSTYEYVTVFFCFGSFVTE